MNEPEGKKTTIRRYLFTNTQRRVIKNDELQERLGY
jgi:hypothetical protein